ncbi:glycosyltransferase [Jannaschia sp. LMIT008]|uniref:glycosyltransferase n=1 Tax=Jannaschia maritima TaxID=3032585 RepID=UPI002810B912|nr:nucleotide disphospho-sugar-binding domain-containing protein [Jannaschia sp. LMIT008]
MTRPAIVLSTIGSHGDLFPVLSLARALDAAGIEPRLGLVPDDCAVARDWGFDAIPVGPSETEMTARLGMSRDEIAASVLRDPGRLMQRALMPLLPSMTDALIAMCDGASAVSATTFAMGASLAAERASLPYVPVLLQPMVTFAPSDAPVIPRLPVTVTDPGPLGRAWNRIPMAAVRVVLRLRHGRDLTRIRRGMGLPPQPGTPTIDHGGVVPFRLGLWDAAFAPAPREWPDLKVVGFPPSPRHDPLSDDVVRWLDDGPAPVVFTLGSVAQALGPPDFWFATAQAARDCGMRAILLHGTADAPRGPDLLTMPRLPHAPLFPRAAAIVHHGGIGTTAEALRAGKPQVVLPVGGDQPDNAARLERLGVARALPIRRFTPGRGAKAIREIMQGFDPAAASELSDQAMANDGAAAAAAAFRELVAT